MIALITFPLVKQFITNRVCSLLNFRNMLQEFRKITFFTYQYRDVIVHELLSDNTRNVACYK